MEVGDANVGAGLNVREDWRDGEPDGHGRLVRHRSLTTVRKGRRHIGIGKVEHRAPARSGIVVRIAEDSAMGLEVRSHLSESMPERRRDEIRVGDQRRLRLTNQRTFIEPQYL